MTSDTELAEYIYDHIKKMLQRIRGRRLTRKGEEKRSEEGKC